MANLVIPMDKYFDTKNTISVRGTATLDDGNIVRANSLATGELDVYNGEQITALTQDSMAMVVGYEFYQDTLGNRPNVSDPTQITYPAGTDVLAYRPEVGSRWFISDDAVATGTPVVNQFIVADANTYTLEAVASLAGTETLGFVVERINYNGSYRGLNPIQGIVVRTVVGY